MPSIPVPSLYQPGIDALVHITDAQYTQLFSALEKAKPALFPSGLASQVKSEVEGLKLSSARDIVESLVAMYAYRTRRGMSASDFAEGVARGINEDGEIELSDEDIVLLTKRLTELLQVEKPLGITSKANDVLTEHEHIFCNVRILTDIRPIFLSDLTSAPSEAVIVHTLKIGYHQDHEHKEFYVALDSADVQKLKAAIERAELKSQSARSLLDKADVLCLDVE